LQQEKNKKMTAKQKANRERFKKVVAEAKKLRKKNPKLTQAQAVKQAWAIMYKGGKVSGSKTHKDTKSHNVNIRVVSGTKKVGAVKIIQKGESKNAKVTKTLQQIRTRKGTFKGYKRIGSINDSKQLMTIAKESPLKAAVVRILKDKAKDYKMNYQSLAKDILYGGLQSGIISELIYYTDTIAWYKKYKKDISYMLWETMQSLGADSPADVFGRNWDKSDPFAEDTHNQNLLAWYSFEETTREIADRLGYEL
jgi:hypothetical protein